MLAHMAIDKKSKTGQDSMPWKVVTYDGKPTDKKGSTFASYTEAASAARAFERETGNGATAIRS